MGAQEDKLGKGSTVRAWGLDFFMEKKTKLNCEQFFYHRIVSPIKRVEFDSYGISCIFLRVRWCNVIVLNMYA